MKLSEKSNEELSSMLAEFYLHIGDIGGIPLIDEICIRLKIKGELVRKLLTGRLKK